MKKVLLAILVFITGVKIIGESSAFGFKYSIVKFAAQEEESKKEKEETKNGKRYSEEICYYDRLEYGISHATAILPSSLSNQEPYCGFLDKPNTPPPDLL